jgi:proteasome lid subunit RPN8/RPN11
VLTLGADILPTTFAALRRCGGGERECVAYWLGPRDEPDRVDEVLQPEHDASPFHYEVHADCLNRFFLDLRARRKSVRAQVHTHPGSRVEHSPTDDSFALAPSRGFVSLVVPHFAMGAITLEGAYSAVITEAGWTDVAPADLIRWN